VNFVVGHPRSGTQLVARLLNAGGGAEVARHEWLAELAPECVRAATEYYENRRDAQSLEPLFAHYDVNATSGVQVDSNWKLTYVLPPLIARFPDGKFVHLTREPAENVRSCFNLDIYGELRNHPDFANDTARNYWHWWMPRIAGVADWEELDPLARNAAFWAETHRLALAHLPRARTLRLQLEELDERRAYELFEFLALPRPPAAALRAALAERVNEKSPMKARVAAHKSPLPPVAEWTAAQRAVVDRYCAPVAREIGY
jgi:Sulfotransferase domain